MKHLLLILLTCASLPAHAQNNYAEAIAQGDAAFKKGEYKLAINKYFAAEAFDPAKKEVVKEKVNGVFDRIERLRGEAEAAKRRADQAKKQAEEALEQVREEQEKTGVALKQVREEQGKTEGALRQVREEQEKTAAALKEVENGKRISDSLYHKADKLVKAFYFYDGRFALAYGEKYGSYIFYFIDKNGDEVEKLGRWNKAEQFDWTGYARIKEWNGDHLVDYLLDTLGNTYQVAFNLKDLNNDIIALDLPEKGLGALPDSLFSHNSLKVLLLHFNKLKSIPSQIQRLGNLITLNLSHNLLSTLSPEIGQLSNLNSLDLGDTRLSSLPPEIGQLKNLTFLSLYYTELISLPPEIGQLINLNSLDLSLTRLSSLPPEIGQLINLNSLDLSKSQLRSMPEEIGQLKNLKVLNLQGTPIPPAEREKIKSWLPNCTIQF